MPHPNQGLLYNYHKMSCCSRTQVNCPCISRICNIVFQIGINSFSSSSNFLQHRSKQLPQTSLYPLLDEATDMQQILSQPRQQLLEWHELAGMQIRSKKNILHESLLCTLVMTMNLLRYCFRSVGQGKEKDGAKDKSRRLHFAAVLIVLTDVRREGIQRFYTSSVSNCVVSLVQCSRTTSEHFFYVR